MRRNSLFAVVAVGIICSSCNRSAETVYVDLDQVLSKGPPAAHTNSDQPTPPAARPALTAIVLGLKETSLADPSNTPRQSIHEMVLAGQAKAQADLLIRLSELNKSAVRAFRLEQESTITGDKAKAFAEANSQIRPLFEKWATDRAPVFSDFTMLEGFPLPEPTDNRPEKPKSLLQQARTARAEKLRTQLRSIDDRFKANSDAILSAVSLKTVVNKVDLAAKVKALEDDLDRKARLKAAEEIHKAESRLSFKLADTAPIKLPQLPSRHLTIPAERALEPAPQVPSSGILDTTADRKRWLEHELRIWLALHRYTLSITRTGHRDATQEFQTWRQLHGAGP